MMEERKKEILKTIEAMYRMYLALEQYIIENHIRVMNSGIKAA